MADSDAVTEDFLDWLRDETFVKRPEVVHRRCLVLWNKCNTTIAGWPELKLAIPNNRATYCVPWNSVPASLREDVEAWLRHLADADPMSLDGPAWPARPATIIARRFQVRQVISALVRRGHDINKFETLRDLVEPPVAKEALRFFYERNGKNKSSQVAGLAAVVFMIAKHWCKLEGGQLDQLALLKRNLAYRLKGMTSKNRERLRQFTERRNIEALIYLPQKIYDAVRRRDGISIANSLDMQVAVAVEMLLMMPVRRANLVRLRFGPEGHIRPRRNRDGTTHVVIDGSDVKNKEDLGRTSDRLWISNLGTDMAETSIYIRVRKVTKREFGVARNPHSFRDSVPTSLAIDDPKHVGAASAILGHADPRVTERHYNLAKSVETVRDHQETIRGLRGSLVRTKLRNGVVE